MSESPWKPAYSDINDAAKAILNVIQFRLGSKSYKAISSNACESNRTQKLDHIISNINFLQWCELKFSPGVIQLFLAKLFDTNGVSG